MLNLNPARKGLSYRKSKIRTIQPSITVETISTVATHIKCTGLLNNNLINDIVNSLILLCLTPIYSFMGKHGCIYFNFLFGVNLTSRLKGCSACRTSVQPDNKLVRQGMLRWLSALCGRMRRTKQGVTVTPLRGLVRRHSGRDGPVA